MKIFIFVGVMILTIILSSWKVDKPKILFLTLKLDKDKLTQIETVSIINKIVVDGQFKGSYVSKVSSSKSSLQLIFLGENKKPIHQIEIENPMSGSLESFDISGAIQRHLVNHHSVEFNVRVRFEDSMKTIQINRIDANKAVTSLSTLNINL